MRSVYVAVLTALAIAAGCSATGGDDPPSERTPPAANGGAGAGTGVGSGGSAGEVVIAPPTGPAGPLAEPPDPEWNGGDKVRIDPSILAQDPVAKLGGPKSSLGKPTLVYPLDGSMHAPNHPEVTFQWRKGASNQELFLIELLHEDATYRFYAPCGKDDRREEGMNPIGSEVCAYTLPQTAWLYVGLTEHGKTFSVTVSGTDPSGSTVGTSDPRSIAFAPEMIRGGVYYWSTSLSGIVRAPFGAARGEPYILPKSDTNKFDCGGCHTLSRDGSTIAFQAGRQYPGGLQVAPTDAPAEPLIEATPSADKWPDGEPKPERPYANRMTLSPEGDWTVVYDHSSKHMRVYNNKTGEATQELPAGAPELGEGLFGHEPSFSPDGTEVLVNLTETRFGHDPNSGVLSDIAVMPFDAAAGKLGKATILVPRDWENRAWGQGPSFSPDGKWVIFHWIPPLNVKGLAESELITAERQSHIDASLRIVPREGGPHPCPGSTCYELANAQQGLGNRAGYAVFSPFSLQDGKLLFFTFNSQMDYGIILENSKSPPGVYPRVPQIWMAAVDVEKMQTGQDGSSAPVWMTIQSPATNNHLALWTEYILCKTDADCGTCQTCEENKCLPDPTCVPR